MFKKRIKFFVVTLALIAVVLGCSKKQVQEINIKNNDEEKNVEDIQVMNDEGQQKENLPVWPEQKYTEADYDGWKTYTNEILGYEIKYPADWTINDCDEGCASKEAIINPPNAEPFVSYVSIFLDRRDLELIRSVYLNPDYYGGNPLEEEKVLFGDMEAYHYYDEENKKKTDKIVFLKDGKPYDITTQMNTNNFVFQIISSFKFLD